MEQSLDAAPAQQQSYRAALVATAGRLAELSEQWRRLNWRLLALGAGFPAAEAGRLAFWRWLAERRGETGQRVLGAG